MRDSKFKSQKEFTNKNAPIIFALSMFFNVAESQKDENIESVKISVIWSDVPQAPSVRILV